MKEKNKKRKKTKKTKAKKQTTTKKQNKTKTKTKTKQNNVETLNRILVCDLARSVQCPGRLRYVVTTR